METVISSMIFWNSLARLRSSGCPSVSFHDSVTSRLLSAHTCGVASNRACLRIATLSVSAMTSLISWIAPSGTFPSLINAAESIRTDM